MQTAYIANPVRVMAARIVEVDGALLTMEGGGMFRADAGMTARYTPVPGDYLVTQEDGYVYVNPKDVFERKYRADAEAPAPELAPHQQRVVDEKDELDKKLAALGAFLGTNPIFGGLPEPERMRLYAQHRAMTTYSSILGERIAAF